MSLAMAIRDDAEREIILSLCRDLKELLYNKGSLSLGVADPFVVVTGLGILMPMCDVEQAECTTWLNHILDKKYVRPPSAFLSQADSLTVR